MICVCMRDGDGGVERMVEMPTRPTIERGIGFGRKSRPKQEVGLIPTLGRPPVTKPKARARSSPCTWQARVPPLSGWPDRSSPKR
jgi:hypothetical protein